MIKILVNGCSHTAANIPDNIKGDPWPKIFCDNINADLVNLAYGGKSNTTILEETIRYLINDNNIDHIIIHYTDWTRLNFYRNTKSFTWQPGDITSQFDRLNGKHSKYYNEDIEPHYRYFTPKSGWCIQLTRNKDTFKTGDASQIYETITAGTLTNCLYQICLAKNIGLTLINYDPLYDAKDDVVWQQIPNDLFLFENNIISGINRHFHKEYEKPDRRHFVHEYHYVLADLVKSHYKNGIQIVGKIDKQKYNPVYDYT